MIDATVLQDGDRYYRFTKVSDADGCPSSDILAQVSPSLRADGASGAWKIIDRCIGRRSGTPEVEGPTAFRANPGDTIRVRAEGVEHIPDGRCLIVSNHSGQLPYDGAMIGTAVFPEAIFVSSIKSQDKS